MPTKTTDADLSVAEFGEFRADFHLRCLYRGSEKVKVGPMAFNVLEFLVKNRHRVISKDELLDHVWGGQRTRGTVEQAVSQLRRILQDDSAEPQYIETVPGHGYRFVAQVLIPTADSKEQDVKPTGGGLESDSPADQISVAAPRPNALFARPVQNIVGWCAAGLLVCIAAIIAAIVIRTHLREPQIGSAVITGNMLTVKDANGNLLWTFPFDATIRPTPTTDPNWRAQVVDFNGDGKSEVLVAVDFLTRSEQNGDTKLLCFSALGKLLWTYRPETNMEFNTTGLNGPWVFHAMLVVDEGKFKSVWVAVGHQIWWPAFIVRISPDGRPETVFASSGIISCLQNVRTKSGTYVLAGGINNEYRMASVAVLASHPVPATSPQSDGSKYQCIRDCPGGRPFRYILLPRSEVNAASEVPYNDVSGMVIRSHGVTIQTSEMAAASQFFDFSEEFRPERVIFSSDYPEFHRRFEKEGRIGHSFALCPEPPNPAVVRIFDENGISRFVSVPRVQ